MADNVRFTKNWTNKFLPSTQIPSGKLASWSELPHFPLLLRRLQSERLNFYLVSQGMKCLPASSLKNSMIGNDISPFLSQWTLLWPSFPFLLSTSPALLLFVQLGCCCPTPLQNWGSKPRGRTKNSGGTLWRRISFSGPLRFALSLYLKTNP